MFRPLARRSDVADATARSPAGDPTLLRLVSEAGLGGSDIQIEILNWPELANRRSEWARLAASALEPNPFLHPSFALPAAQHLIPARQAEFFVASRLEPGAGRRMVGLMPIAAPQAAGGLANAWANEYAPLGIPLLADSCARAVWPRLFQALCEQRTGPAGVRIPFAWSQGPTAALLADFAQGRGLGLAARERWERPILRISARSAANGAAAARRRKTSRQARKLAQLGAVRSRAVTKPDEMRDAVEQFLALEAGGWKGRRGTAMLLDPGAVTFARSMARLMARDGQIRIDALHLDGTVLAMTISLIAGSRAVLWKSAYDERYAAYSPGALLIAGLPEEELRGQGVELIDSCASPDNQMIYRMWDERAPIADLFIAGSHGSAPAFEAALARADLQRKALQTAKAAYEAARRRLGQTARG